MASAEAANVELQKYSCNKLTAVCSLTCIHCGSIFGSENSAAFQPEPFNLLIYTIQLIWSDCPRPLPALFGGPSRGVSSLNYDAWSFGLPWHKFRGYKTTRAYQIMCAYPYSLSYMYIYILYTFNQGTVSIAPVGEKAFSPEQCQAQM